LNPHTAEEASKEKMIQSSEGMIWRESDYAMVEFFPNWIIWINIRMEGF
jgi:hypothetical protein